MKNFKILIVLIVLFGTISASYAQRVVKVYPRHGTVVTKIYKPKVIVHHGVNYHFASGIWYKARGRKFVVCAAPRGVVVSQVPKGRKIVYINGKKHFKFKGIWYTKKGNGYMVVHV